MSEPQYDPKAWEAQEQASKRRARQEDVDALRLELMDAKARLSAVEAGLAPATYDTFCREVVIAFLTSEGACRLKYLDQWVPGAWKAYRALVESRPAEPVEA